MAIEIKLPQLGKTMEDGTIVNCLVQIGQKVEKGDILFEIETDKATLEMESPADGFVIAILAQQGQTLSVGEVLLILGEDNEQVVLNTDIKQTSQKVAEKPAKVTAQADLIAALKEARISNPQVYKLGQKIPLTKLGGITAEQMLKSKHEKPCFYLNVNVDVTELVAFQENLNRSAGIKISFNDILIKALALGLIKWPIMTGRLEGDFVRLADSIGIALAIVVDEGLIAPIVKDVDKKSLSQIAQYSASLIERTKEGKLTLDDLQGGCMTVSNLGPLGVDSFIPIVVPGQCSILGVGKLADTCVSKGGEISIRKLMKMSLSVDHRIANGAEAAQFLNYVAELLQEPQKLT
jgi:pyruvate dehydrogenase E2 component (dihydrolipoamide acetyltransferase)